MYMLVSNNKKYGLVLVTLLMIIRLCLHLKQG